MLRRLALSVLICAAPLPASDPLPVVSGERVRDAVKYLASDQLEGRGPGDTRGEELTTRYLADEFKKAGLKPLGEKGSYFQPVPLVSVETRRTTILKAVKGDAVVEWPLEEGFAGTTHTQAAVEEIDAEVVFVGHGITAPEFGWDDYQGIDVKGKVVVLFTNEPPSDDAKFFGGKALTYYGRWTYKFEEATRRGARAVLIIHTPETAGYPYSVVKVLDGMQMERDPKAHALAFAGWVSSKIGEQMLAHVSKTVEVALKEANTAGFKPYPLGFRLKGKVESLVQKVVSKNVVGIIEGSDPDLKAEAVVFTAHWDHLGVRKGASLGDNIYNGAADNATGCGLLLELARAWGKLPAKPKRSAVFLAVTAEEKGLLGSKYYAAHPLVPLGKTALNLNFDMILPLGVPEAVVANGAERTTVWGAVQQAAKRSQVEVQADPRANLGTYYRSDHFSFARAGVPAFSVGNGSKMRGKADDFVAKAAKEFNDKEYHTPADELKADWDFAGFEVIGRFALQIAVEVANAPALPTWNSGDEFLPARVKSGVK
ncbi:MAG: M28 family peptidase [Fimbriiglobus sp.]|jgi:Zn-dependent M28 family amino/carboxypeptidase|nr:M28 family peptidase [Fimbriiglobus sp.]